MEGGVHLEHVECGSHEPGDSIRMTARAPAFDQPTQVRYGTKSASERARLDSKTLHHLAEGGKPVHAWPALAGTLTRHVLHHPADFEQRADFLWQKDDNAWPDR
jgi:hypothetical protein